MGLSFIPLLFSQRMSKARQLRTKMGIVLFFLLFSSGLRRGFPSLGLFLSAWRGRSSRWHHLRNGITASLHGIISHGYCIPLRLTTSRPRTYGLTQWRLKGAMLYYVEYLR